MLSRNDFAKSVISRLAQLGAKVCPRYDELSYCFFVDVSAAAATGKSGYLRLEKWYDRYQEALLDGRGDQAIDELARFWIQLVAQDASLPSLDTARMLPLVRHGHRTGKGSPSSAASRVPAPEATAISSSSHPTARSCGRSPTAGIGVRRRPPLATPGARVTPHHWLGPSAAAV